MLRISYLFVCVCVCTTTAADISTSDEFIELKESKISNASARALVFKADFSKPTLSQAFGGSGISYGNQNVILWASGGGIDVVYPAGSYVPSGPIVGGFGIWSNHPVSSNTAVFKYSVYFPDNFNFVKGGRKLIFS